MSATSARLRAIERSLRPLGKSGEDPESERLLASSAHASFAPSWWPSAVRLAARAQGATPETVDAAARGHPCAGGWGPRYVVRAMLRHGPAWLAMTEQEQMEAVGAEEQIVFEREARAILVAVAALGLHEFRDHDLLPAMGEAAWTIGNVLRELAELGVLVQAGEDAFGIPLYRLRDDLMRGGRDDDPSGEPPEPNRRPQRSRRGDRVTVEDLNA